MWLPKNAEYDADFEFVEKVAKSLFTQRKLEFRLGRRNKVHCHISCRYTVCIPVPVVSVRSINAALPEINGSFHSNFTLNFTPS